ncbi:hypothetical protein [Sphingobacterium siyangense]|jgi:hypothetical protein|uniref:hypothetical protein n=1 Tax=Sphingobacterium siyangense TaxID=459529 RepID=UPI00301ACBE1
MAFESKVFKILIASPGDVDEERKAIPEIISDWNNANSEVNKVVLLPVKWETHSAPLLGDRPQGIINSQLLTTCDMAIGVFWTRIGSPTGVSESGTAEEIEWFIENKKPVMIYFSSRDINPTKLDLDQYKSLTDFKNRLRKIGLTGSYENLSDFKEQLLRQLSINVRKLLDNPDYIESLSPVTAKEKEKEIKKILKADRIYIEDYEKDGKIKTFLVKGDTTSIKTQLKEMGGRWNNSLKGWIFTKNKEIEVAEFIKKNK